MTTTMRPATAVCRWCGATFKVKHAVGTVPKYCRASHRQRAYEYRRDHVPTPESDEA